VEGYSNGISNSASGRSRTAPLNAKGCGAQTQRPTKRTVKGGHPPRIIGLGRYVREKRLICVKPSKPAIPMPKSSNVPGSGVAITAEGRGPIVPPVPPVAPVTVQVAGVTMVFVSSVTEASSDMTLPHPIVAPVSITSPASEIIVPRKLVVVPRVAPDKVAQVMLP